MKTNNIYIALITLIISLTSCSVDTIRISSNDPITYRDIRNIDDYSKIEIANDINAYITFSDTEESIEIEATDVLQDHISATIENNKLNIKFKGSINYRGNATLNVYIKTKSIIDFKASSDSKIYLENVLAENNTKISVSSDAYFTGEVDVDNLEISASSDANVDLYGYVNTLDAHIASDAKLSDYDLEVSHLEINMSSDAKAYLTVTETMDINDYSDAALYYKGNAVITDINLNSDAKVRNKN